MQSHCLFHIALFLGIIGMVTPIPMFAAEFRIGSYIEIQDSEQVLEDFYTLGGQINIERSIIGDLLVTGGEVRSTGSISDDLMVIGGEVVISGNIGDDVRIAGGEITLSGEVGDDLLITGGRVLITEDAVIHGSTYLGGGEIEVHGTFMDTVEINAKQIFFDARVHKDLKVHAETFTISEHAQIMGDLDYVTTNEISAGERASVVGEVNFSPLPNRFLLFGFLGVGALITFLSMLIAGVTVTLAMKKVSRNIVRTTLTSFLNSLWKGSVILFFGPGIALLLGATIIGAPLGLLVFLMYMTLLMLAWVYAGVVVGSFIFSYIKRNEGYTASLQRTIIGVFVLGLALLIPIFGAFTFFLVFLATLGALGKRVVQILWESKPQTKDNN